MNLSKSDVEYEEKEVNLAASSDRAVPSSKQLGRGRPSRREKRMRNTLPRPSKKLRLKEGSPFQGRTFRKDTSSGAEPLKDLSQDAEPTNSFQILSRDKASLLHKLNRTISGHKESLIAKDKAISGKSSSVRFVSSGDSNKFIGSVPFSQAIGHQPLKLALGRQKQAKAKQSLEKTIKGAIELIQAKKLSILRKLKGQLLKRNMINSQQLSKSSNRRFQACLMVSRGFYSSMYCLLCYMALY